ncbi:MAG: hypothetical protein E5W70_30725 [Mesorhizobium sp.]|nr:MAG: hypothetical protein E5W70_30725 [Mesorhizobium sp.]
MRLATLNLETARYGDVYRATRLARLRRQMVRHIERTDASAQKVEQALAKLAEANAPHGPASVGPRSCPPSHRHDVRRIMRSIHLTLLSLSGAMLIVVGLVTQWL